jgi:SLT domain-containing protein
VLDALKQLHQPASYLGITLRRMNQESGGNPTIVNKWDSNWKAGHPSVGLMQVIGPTFRAYAGKYMKKGPFLYGTSVDPLANIYSSMRYALAAYGSLPRAYNRAGGYDSGGYLQPGLNLAYNGTGRPEPVFTTTQANALMRLAVEPGTGGGTFEGDLYLDSGEFMGKVHGIMNQRDQQLISTLRANRRG